MVSDSAKSYVGCHMAVNKILLLLLLLWTTAATCSFIRTNKLNNNAPAADTTSNRIKATTSNKSAATQIALPPTYVWGCTTKYASVLYDEDIIVKGLNALDIKYPENDDSNNMTIIGIYASDKLDTAASILLTALNFSIYLREGGIGHNFTTVHFVSNTDKDVKYNLKIYGLDI